MVQLVLGIGIFHTPMLSGSLEDWQRFIEADRARSHLDKEATPVSYEDFLAQADAAMANLQTIRDAIQATALDTLIVVGESQNALYEEAAPRDYPVDAKLRAPQRVRQLEAATYPMPLSSPTVYENLPMAARSTHQKGNRLSH
jgi:hypothetical protein